MQVTLCIGDVIKDGKVVCTLRVYATNERILGFSLDGIHIGGKRSPKADRTQKMEPLILESTP